MIVLNTLHNPNTWFFVTTVRSSSMMPDQTMACREVKVRNTDGASRFPLDSWDKSGGPFLALFVSVVATSRAKGVTRWQIIMSRIIVHNTRAAWSKCSASCLCIAQWREILAWDLSAKFVAKVNVKIVFSDIYGWLRICLSSTAFSRCTSSAEARLILTVAVVCVMLAFSTCACASNRSWKLNCN